MTGIVRFLAIALGVYALSNTYILRRTFQGLEGLGWLGTSLRAFLVLWVLAFPAGRIAERVLPWAGFSRFLVVTGSFYLGVMATSIFLFFGCDIALLAGRVFPTLPFFGHSGPVPSSLRRGVLLFVTLITALVTIAGTVNSLLPRTRETVFEFSRGFGKPMRVVFFSDLHMGPLVGNGRVRDLVKRVNALAPDLVLLGGDIVDEDVSRLAEEKMAEALGQLSPRLGCFAVTGNHEYYAGEQEAVSYLQSAGIRVLRDETVMVEDRLVIAGRKDRTATRFGERRLPLQELLREAPKGLPVLLLDHQPRSLKEAESAGVDLQLSGHTHNGQLFPFNLVTGLLFEVSRGWKTLGSLSVLVSSGVGTWGPPMRTSAAPEIWLLELRFPDDS